MDYRSPAEDPHLIAEEVQWARVLACGDDRRGMALVYVQKFCTAVHEFEPAFRAGVLPETPEALAHVRARLLARLDYTHAVLKSGGLAEIDGVDRLLAIRAEINAAKSLAELMALTEPIHQLGHTLCEALEA